MGFPIPLNYCRLLFNICLMLHNLFPDLCTEFYLLSISFNLPSIRMIWLRFCWHFILISSEYPGTQRIYGIQSRLNNHYKKQMVAAKCQQNLKTLAYHKLNKFSCRGVSKLLMSIYPFFRIIPLSLPLLTKHGGIQSAEFENYKPVSMLQIKKVSFSWFCQRSRHLCLFGSKKINARHCTDNAN